MCSYCSRRVPLLALSVVFVVPICVTYREFASLSVLIFAIAMIWLKLVGTANPNSTTINRLTVALPHEERPRQLILYRTTGLPVRHR